MKKRTQEVDPAATGKRPLISIVVCTHNRAHLLPLTLDSLLAQRYRPVEIVVLDDGSSDGTRQVLQRYGDRIRFASQPNSGISVARTAAARLARGELIAFHDDDDPMPENRLVLLQEALREYPEAVFAVGDWVLVDAEGRPTGSRWLPDTGQKGPRLVVDGFDGVLWPRLPVAPHTTLFRKSDGEAVGWFDPRFRHAGEDKDFFARLALQGPVVYVPRIVSYLRRDPGHQSMTGNELRTAYFALLLYQKHLETARDRDRRLFSRLQQRMRMTLEQVDRLSPGVPPPKDLFPENYLQLWLPQIGTWERLMYQWRTKVRAPLARGWRRRVRPDAG